MKKKVYKGLKLLTSTFPEVSVSTHKYSDKYHITWSVGTFKAFLDKRDISHTNEEAHAELAKKMTKLGWVGSSTNLGSWWTFN